MRFRTALLWSTVALVAGSLAVTVGAILAVAGRSARAQLTSDLARSRAAFETVHAERQVLMRSEARVMAEEPRLKAVVATEEVSDQTVLGVALDLRKALQSDLFIITDPEGAVRADTADPTATGKGLGGNAQIAQAFSQGDSAGVWIDGARLYQVQARRLAFGATTVGALAIGYQIGRAHV